jgi:heat-inducible transcriptional repressor
MNIPALTDRQIQILKYIIEEYISSGEAVGSDTLDRKHNLGVSPATIRNEMVALAQQGYLEQLHTSSGRVPTPQSLRFYITQLMEEKDLTVGEEVDMKSKLWDFREEVDRLLREATRLLAQKSRGIAVASTQKGTIYHSGYANILDIPEFFDIDVTRTVLSLIDNESDLQIFFQKAGGHNEPVHIMLGDDFESEHLYPCGFVHTTFDFGLYGEGNLGVIGPSRLDYPYIIPMIRYFGKLLDEIAEKWR